MPFLAKYFLKESVSKVDIIALGSGFVGIVLMNQPQESTPSPEMSNQIIGVTLSLIGGISSSIAWICIRKMSEKCHYSIASFYFSVGSTILGGALYMINMKQNKSLVEYNFTTIVLLILVSLITFVGQITLVLAYQYEKAARVAVFSYLQTFLVMVYDTTFFGTAIGFTELVGAVLIIGCNFIIAVMKFVGVLQ